MASIRSYGARVLMNETGKERLRAFYAAETPKIEAQVKELRALKALTPPQKGKLSALVRKLADMEMRLTRLDDELLP